VLHECDVCMCVFRERGVLWHAPHERRGTIKAVIMLFVNPTHLSNKLQKQKQSMLHWSQSYPCCCPVQTCCTLFDTPSCPEPPETK
jgi:hypothetical protein